MLACLDAPVLPSFSVMTEYLPSLSSSAKKPRNAFSDWAWDTRNFDSYQCYVTGLSRSIIQECYGCYILPHWGSNVMTEACRYYENVTIRGSDTFFAFLSPIASKLPALAEKLFILIIKDILSFNGPDSEAHLIITTLILKHLMSPSCEMQQAARLGCGLLVLLLRHELTKFNAKRPRRINDLRGLKLEGCFTQIQLSIASETALRCKLPCTALLFHEVLYIEFLLFKT